MREGLIHESESLELLIYIGHLLLCLNVSLAQERQLILLFEDLAPKVLLYQLIARRKDRRLAPIVILGLV